MANEDYVSIKIRREVNQVIKLVAALNGQTIQQWLEWTSNRAYESSKRNKK